MDAMTAAATLHKQDVLGVLKRYWGFDALRPMQQRAIAATLAGRDSLTVLPTGGGKSLCYQLPALVRGKWTLVVSPLIALMQDQVAALTSAGVPAAALHSMADRDDARAAREGVESGEVKLLFAAPERIVGDGFLAWLARLQQRGLGPGAIAVDEAHCISQWGHDFRPEYRRLAELREVLPTVCIGAYTATATPRVREDIVSQLRLREPAVLVGSFDRPNLTYRVLPRVDVARQTAEAVQRHEGSAAIVYCISRKETESLAEALREQKIDAAAYHAGMTPTQRTRVSDNFRRERLGVVVATVAFGMGIDRGDVRCVVHAGLPKSVEHYQQETGRAGRDGLPAECLLLYSSADAARWRQLMQGGDGDDASLAAQLDLLDKVQRFACATRCRHAALVEYFGQELAGEGAGAGCGACDVCLGELVPVPDAHRVAQMILSCVYRCGQRYGAGHVADVLLGKPTAKVRECGHDRLSTYGLLPTHTKGQLTSYIGQLVDGGLLERVGDAYPVLSLGPGAHAVLKNQRTAVLVEAKPNLSEETAPATRTSGGSVRKSARKAGAGSSLDAAERRLFERLRLWRRELADERGVPPYVICNDATLEELCAVRPASRDALATVKGIGARKLEDLGPLLLPRLATDSAAEGLELGPTASR